MCASAVMVLLSGLPRSWKRLRNSVIFRKLHVLSRVVRASTCEEPHQNAFSVLMTNARYSVSREAEERNQASMPSLPERIPVRNKKDELYNDLLQFLESKNVAFENIAAACTTGKQFMTTLVNVLWYLDGHHSKLKTFSDHHSAIPRFPKPFESFCNYKEEYSSRSNEPLSQWPFAL